MEHNFTIENSGSGYQVSISVSPVTPGGTYKTNLAVGLITYKVLDKSKELITVGVRGLIDALMYDTWWEVMGYKTLFCVKLDTYPSTTTINEIATLGQRILTTKMGEAEEFKKLVDVWEYVRMV